MLATLRYARGVIPVSFKNARLKFDRLEYPESKQISVIAFEVSDSKEQARDMRTVR